MGSYSCLSWINLMQEVANDISAHVASFPAYFRMILLPPIGQHQRRDNCLRGSTRSYQDVLERDRGKEVV